MNGWGKVWARFGAMAAAVILIGILALWAKKELRQIRQSDPTPTRWEN